MTMVRALFLNLFVLLLIASHIYMTHLQAQEIKIEGKKIEYTLPYAGILPDHPLYFVKAARDGLLQFFTRDNYKKAQLDLLLADKRLSMAKDLSVKGKWQLTTSTLIKGEKYMSYIPGIVIKMKKQGSSPPQDFILTSRLSSEKHQEIIEDLIQDAPSNEIPNLEEALKINADTERQLSKL
jgi:hypothetical protein